MRDDTKLEAAVYAALKAAAKNYFETRNDPQKQVYGRSDIDLLRDQIGDVIAEARNEVEKETSFALLTAITKAAEDARPEEALHFSQAYKNIYGGSE